MKSSDVVRLPGMAGVMLLCMLAACLMGAAATAGPLHCPGVDGTHRGAVCAAIGMRGAGVGAAAGDSLQLARLQALEARQDSLQKRLQQLQDEQKSGSRPEKEIQADISGTVDVLFAVSKEIVLLTDAIASGTTLVETGGAQDSGVYEMDVLRVDRADSAGEGGNEAFRDSWDSETGSAEGADDGEERQFDFHPDRFMKKSAVFPWPFPRESRLCESNFRYNRVEGFYLGIAQPKRLYWKSQPVLVGIGSLGYGFASHRWRYSAGIFLPLYLASQIVEFGVEGYSFTDSRDQWIIDRDENTAMAFFAREDFLDYFSREGFTASASWYARGQDNTMLKAGIAYVHDSYESLERNAAWSLFGGDKEFRSNPAIGDGNLNSVVVSAGVSSDVTFARNQEGWDVQASFEKAGGFAKGDHDFSQIVLDARRYQPLADFLNVNLRFRLGASDGSVPLQRSFELGGIGTLPGYRFKEFAGTHTALVNTEFIFRASSMGEMTGWVAKVLGAVNLVLFFDAGAVNDAKNMTISTWRGGSPVFQNTFSDGLTFGEWKTDAGVAIGSHDGDFRIGAAWRLDRPSSPELVIRLSRPF